jgi:hypothetical protein
VNFFDADGLSGEDGAEVEFFLAQTDPATTRDDDGLIVQRIVDVRQSGLGAIRGLIGFLQGISWRALRADVGFLAAIEDLVAGLREINLRSGGYAWALVERRGRVRHRATQTTTQI